MDRDELLRQAGRHPVHAQRLRTSTGVTFRVRGDTVEIIPAAEQETRPCGWNFSGTKSTASAKSTSLTGERAAAPEPCADLPRLPLCHVRQDKTGPLHCSRLKRTWKNGWLSSERKGKLLEAQRLEQRTTLRYRDAQGNRLLLAALRTIPGISTGGRPGEPPFTLLDYFPKDFLLFVDESHVTLAPDAGHVQRRLRPEAARWSTTASGCRRPTTTGR